MDEFIQAYYDEKRGWRLFMPNGEELPAQCEAKVVVSDNWNNKEKPIPTVTIEMPCRVVNIMPEQK